MIFWIGLVVLCIILGVVAWGYAKNVNKYDTETTFQILGMISFIFAFLIALCIFAEWNCFRNFETSYEIQQTQIQTFKEENESLDMNSIVYIADIVESNERLTNYQARYSRWGEISLVPARVMDMAPLWLE